MIHLQLLNNVLHECLEEKSAVTIWLKLQSICMQKDLINKMHIMMKLFMHKLQERGSILTHILSNNFRDIILYNHDILTVAKVYEALSAKEKMRQIVNSEDAGGLSEEALNVRGRTG
jgi:hypothetical protein